MVATPKVCGLSSTLINQSSVTTNATDTTALLLSAEVGTDSSNVATTSSSSGTLYIAGGGGGSGGWSHAGGGGTGAVGTAVLISQKDVNIDIKPAPTTADADDTFGFTEVITDL